MEIVNVSDLDIASGLEALCNKVMPYLSEVNNTDALQALALGLYLMNNAEDEEEFYRISTAAFGDIQDIALNEGIAVLCTGPGEFVIKSTEELDPQLEVKLDDNGAVIAVLSMSAQSEKAEKSVVNIVLSDEAFEHFSKMGVINLAEMRDNIQKNGQSALEKELHDALQEGISV